MAEKTYKWLELRSNMTPKQFGLMWKHLLSHYHGQPQRTKRSRRGGPSAREVVILLEPDGEGFEVISLSDGRAAP